MRRENPGLPPGPWYPPIVQTLRWLYQPMSFMDECAARWGDTFTVRLNGIPPLVFTSDPEAVKDIFTADPHAMHAGEANQLLRPILGDNSILLLDGDRHLRDRKLMLPPFHGERMAAYGAIIGETTDRDLAAWPRRRRFALHPHMQAITLDVIMRAVLGVEEGPAYGRLRELLKQAMSFGEHPTLMLFVNSEGDLRFPRLQQALGRLSPWIRFRGISDEIDALLTAEFDRRRRAGTRGRADVLSLLLEAVDDKGRHLTNEELRDEMMTLLVAGHETSATTLTWAVSRLLRHGDVLARLRSLDGAQAEEYAEAIVKETLRLHPIIPVVGRVLKKPARVGGVSLPEGVVAAPCVYLAHRRAATWPDPLRFDPDRFLGKKISPYEWFPFGGGVRRCLGMAFSLYEMRIALPRIARLPLRLAPGYKTSMRRRGVTLAVANGLPVIVG